jgi:arylsulfatase A-like enzyme
MTKVKRLLVGLLLALLVSNSATPFAAVSSDQPNFVIILADDLGYGDLGCYGQKRIRTPNLDKMASEGMRFTEFYVASSLCTPSRAALLTGSYAQRVGMGVCSREQNGKIVPWHVLYPNMQQGFNPDEITIAESLKARGYATACIGKWHLGDRPEFLPTNQGFDYYFGVPYSNDMKPLVFLRGDKVAETTVAQETITERYTDEAVRYIGAHRDKPFFLYLAHNAPHTPLFASPRFKGKSAGGLYGDVVEGLDWSVGEVLSALKREGIEQKTMVVFLSDNGPWLVRGENGGIATPLRDGKGSTYEGGMRVPFIVRWPGTVPAGKVCKEVASAMDLFPTMAKLCGAEIPKDRVIDGKDIVPLVKGEPGARSPHEVLYYYFMDELQGVRRGEWKLKLETTVKNDSLYTHVGDPESTVPTALYNLEADIGEQKSVLKNHAELVNELEAAAAKASEDLGDSRTGVQGKNRRPSGHSDTPSVIGAVKSAGGD